MKRLLLVSVLFLVGCDQAGTGPKMVDQVLAFGETVFLESAKDLKATQGMMEAGGAAHNPEYEATMIIAPACIYTKFNMRLIGVSVDASTQAAMGPDDDIDPTYDIELIASILREPFTSRERKQQLLLDLTDRHLAFWEKLLNIDAVEGTPESISTDGF